MNLDKLEQKLLHAARRHTPSDAVPYAFEKRIMARLTERTPAEQGASWFRALWGAAACSAAIALLAGAWTLLPMSGTSRSWDMAQEFETTVFAMVDEVNDTW